MKSFAQKLFDAAWSGNPSVIQAVFDEAPDIEQPALDHALEAAAYNAKSDACKLLLQLGADPNTCQISNHESVLHQVITKTGDLAERTKIVDYLVAKGAEVNCRTIPGVLTECFMRDIRTRGETPLHRAAAYGSADMIQLLLAAGADKSAKDAHGESPLTWASWHLRDSKVLKLLLYGEFTGSIR